jgi:UDP-4-amino-4,6-dideoxy-N-acetyl-beta-L-altrosamine N-acetyltransferase
MIRLRPIRDSDCDTIHGWRTLPEVADFMYTDHEITLDEHRRWFCRIRTDSSCIYQIIELDGEGVGVVYITGIDRKNRRCSWGFYLASPAVRGRGVGSFVEYSVLEHVFSTLGLNKLCCEVFTSNKAVIRMHESFGFRREGVYRQHIFKQGEFHEVVALAILAEEWKEKRGSIEQRLLEKGILDGTTGPSSDSTDSA